MTDRDKFNNINEMVKRHSITVDRAMELLGELYATVVFDGDGSISPDEIDCNAVKLTILEDSEKMKAKILEKSDERRRKLW